MNLIRQRDDLKAACETGCISKEQLELALASPVFQWWAGTRHMSEAEEEWLFTNVMERHDVMLGKGAVSEDYMKDVSHDLRNEHLTPGTAAWPRVVPYDCFRISYLDSPVYEQWWIGKEKCLCFRCDDRYSHQDVKMWSVHSTGRGEGQYKLWVWLNGIKLNLFGEKKKAGKIEMVVDDDELSTFASSPMQFLSFFLFDVMSNTSVVVRVRPSVEGKSVQWHKAREHLLVMHHSKAQKCQQEKKGPSDSDIIRGAHWRRAHLRRLISDKFKHKKGLLVPVRKAWVGPTEWKGSDNKTYKIVSFEPKPLT